MDEKTLVAILDAFPYPIVFVDCEHVIRFLKKTPSSLLPGTRLPGPGWEISFRLPPCS